MKVVVTLSTPEVEGPFEPRFGRAAWFGVVDLETGSTEVIENAAASAPSGAGVKAAQQVIKAGAEVVIAGSFGPHAFEVLSAAGVRMYVGEEGRSGSAVVEQYRSGSLPEVTQPTHGGHHHHAGGGSGGRA